MCFEKVWTLPFSDNLQDEIENDEVCVVGVFGKSTFGHCTKDLVINKLVKSNIFNPNAPFNFSDKGQLDFKYFKPHIEGFYDNKKRIFYLHLTTMFDTSMLAEACAKINNLESFNNNPTEFHKFFKTQDMQIVLALVFLFSISHFILLVHPVSTFDISYDRLFKHVNFVRTKLQPAIKEVLKDCPVGRDWWVNGRPCPPRILFVFFRCHLSSSQLKSERNSFGDGKRMTQHSTLAKFQIRLEDQIWRIFRNSRVLGNVASNNLFTVPLNLMFCHIMTKQYDDVKNNSDPIKSMLFLLKESSRKHRNSKTASKAYELLCSDPAKWKDWENREFDSCINTSFMNESNNIENENLIYSFIKPHVDAVHKNEGFDDNNNCNAAPPNFELPILKNWIITAQSLYQLFFDLGMDPLAKKLDVKDKAISNQVSEVLNHMQAKIDPETHFSETNCNKFLRIGTGTYQNNLPSHYTSKVHNNQLQQALEFYNTHARGPARGKYEQILYDECDAYWNDGRRLCEVRSLTGRHCIHRFHQLPSSKSPSLSNLPTMNHCSRSRSLASSNCGRVQFQREDPFTLKEANFEFYNLLSQKTQPIMDSDIYSFSTYSNQKLNNFQKKDRMSEAVILEKKETEPAEFKSISLNRDNQLINSEVQLSNKQVETELESYLEQDLFTLKQSTPYKDVQDLKNTNSPTDFKLSQDGHGNLSDYDNDLSQHSQSSQYSMSSFEDIGVVKNRFTSGMLNSQVDDGVLPLFSSWSLIRIAPYSSYNPLVGLEMPGFLKDSNFLLPWEVNVESTENSKTESWPAPGESSRRIKKVRETKLTTPKEVYKVYVGYEYETNRGHRFICSAPNKVYKNYTGVNKDLIESLLDKDMPLYTPSPINMRSGKPMLGQLMRVYIAIPNNQSIKISIKPRVVTDLSSDAPMFYPCKEDVQLRHNSLWVLRLPYVYVNQEGISYHLAKDHSNLSVFKVLKMISLQTNSANVNNTTDLLKSLKV